MIIYGASLSPFVRKAAAFAREKGLDFEHLPVPPNADDPEFRKCSPFGKIPGFRDGDYCLSDSTAIVHYLEAKHPEPALVPADPEARGRTIWYDEFADTIMVAAAGAIFFNRIVARALGAEPDLAAADKAEKEALPPVLDYVEGQLSDGREWLVGDGLTLADLSVAAPFKNLEYAGVSIDGYPKTKAYVDRITGRESFAALLEMDQGFLKQIGAA